jgi:hypothetical protein
MATVEVIRDIGETLLFLLRSSIDTAIVNPNNIELSTPDDFEADPAQPHITIFLYRIAVNSELRNRPRRVLPDGSTTRPLIPLELFYMITPWARSTSDEYRIIGRIIQCMYDNSELGASQFQGTAWEPGDSAQIILESLPIDDHYRIWDASSLPYRLSITYAVRVIGIEPGEAVNYPPVTEAEFRRLRTI